MLEAVGEQALARFDKPDAGLWEFRTREAVHSYSAAMCWAAADRLAIIARELRLPDREDYWRSAADRMRHVIEDRAGLSDERGFGAAPVISNDGLSSLMRTTTSPPETSLPNSNSSASGCLICVWMSRASGRAPYILS